MSTFLGRKLQNSQQEKSVSISVRIPRADLETLHEMELETGFHYDWLLRMLIHRLVNLWDRKKRISFPLYVAILNEDEARRLGLTDEH
jgi:hypothetical protein